MGHPGERELIWKGAKFSFERVLVRRGSTGAGAEGAATLWREMVRHPGAVCILPILEEPPGRAPTLVLIRNHRFTVGRELWELPAGTIEPGEAPAACAPRELEEETGYAAREIRALGTFLTTPGMTDEHMHAFVARGLTPVGQRLEADETIVAEAMGLDEVWRMIDRGELVDAKSMVTLMQIGRAHV